MANFDRTLSSSIDMYSGDALPRTDYFDFARNSFNLQSSVSREVDALRSLIDQVDMSDSIVITLSFEIYNRMIQDNIDIQDSVYIFKMLDRLVLSGVDITDDMSRVWQTWILLERNLQSTIDVYSGDALQTTNIEDYARNSVDIFDGIIRTVNEQVTLIIRTLADYIDLTDDNYISNISSFIIREQLSLYDAVSIDNTIKYFVGQGFDVNDAVIVTISLAGAFDRVLRSYFDLTDSSGQSNLLTRLFQDNTTMTDSVARTIADYLIAQRFLQSNISVQTDIEISILQNIIRSFTESLTVSSNVLRSFSLTIVSIALTRFEVDDGYPIEFNIRGL